MKNTHISAPAGGRVLYLGGCGLFVTSATYLWLHGDWASLGSFWSDIVSSSLSRVMIFIACVFYVLAFTSLLLRRNSRVIERPFTGSLSYRFFYSIGPVLGAASGLVAVIFSGTTLDALTTIAAGAVVVTVIVWLLIDPVVAFAEAFLPQSRRLRKVRFRLAKQRRGRKKWEKQKIIDIARMQSTSPQTEWDRDLIPYALELAQLACDTQRPEDIRRARAVDIALQATQIGGKKGMRRLYDMASEVCEDHTKDTWIARNISHWWDGVGGWRDNETLTDPK